MLIYWFAAALLLAAGHILKTMRWRRFVAVYENTSFSPLLKALTGGYLLNFFLPLRVGDVARIILSGRRMENGCSYATATILVDRLLDVLAVALIFWIFALVAPTAQVCQTALTYLFLVLALAAAFGGMMLFHNPCKRLALLGCSIFNESIKYRLLYFFWSLICSFKDLAHRVKLLPLLLETAAMWAAYLASYFCATLGLQALGTQMLFSDVFFLIFSSDSLLQSTFTATLRDLSPQAALWLSGYILAPLPFLLAGSLVLRRPSDREKTIRLLPHLDQVQQMQFLNIYFASDQRQAIHEYLNMNRDVSIIRDCSAGSDATTMLCAKPGQTVYRKYAFGETSAKKLTQQAQWLHQWEERLPLPQIVFERQGQYSFCYDMQFDPTAVGMLSYICSHDASQSWAILETALTALQANLYAPTTGALVSAADVQRYIEEKVQKNLAQITQHRALQALCAAENLTINGKIYRGLPQLRSMLEPGHLQQVFSGEKSCIVHGDLTVENLICRIHDGSYYFIDPNPDNPIKTPGVDYGKLLQSLHGRYELLSQSRDVEVDSSNIRFLLMDVPQYRQLLGAFDDWLRTQLTFEQLRGVYYHEIVHWLRLMPYKLRKDEASAGRYFAAMIMVMNDIYDRFEEKP